MLNEDPNSRIVNLQSINDLCQEHGKPRNVYIAINDLISSYTLQADFEAGGESLQQELILLHQLSLIFYKPKS